MPLFSMSVFLETLISPDPHGFFAKATPDPMTSSLPDSLGQLSDLKDRFVLPTLGAFRIVKEYIGVLHSKHKMEQKTDTVVLDSLSRRGTPRPIDYKFTDSGKAQRERVQELMSRPTLPPPFPDELPNRPHKTRANKWQYAFFGMILIFIGVVAPLALLVARRGLANHAAAATPIGEQAVSTVTETVTQTATQWNTSITTQMMTSLQTVTQTSVQTSSRSTSQPKSTSGGDSCDNIKVFLAPKFCVMVTECTQPKLDIQANDCKSFCNAQPACKKDDKGSLTGHLKDCCGHCGCFD